MQLFAQLVYTLGTSTKNSEKIAALENYFTTACDADKIWVIAIFSGRRPKRIVSSTTLQIWCAEITKIPLWLFQECYHTVGDLAETIALLLPKKNNTATNNSIPNQTLSYYLEQFIALEKQDEIAKKTFITACWQTLNSQELFVFNKLITGGFRIGVSQKTMVNALAKSIQMQPSEIAHKISGRWNASTTKFTDLLSTQNTIIDFSKPYPFYLAYAAEEPISNLGNMAEWQAEWKWDGIRGQIIKRNNELFVWSRGEELITEKFPEFNAWISRLPNGCVLDVEIICMNQNTPNFQPLPFSFLQTRIGRKNITKKQLTAAPVGFIAYDLLEFNSIDIRSNPLQKRREELEKIIELVDDKNVIVSPIIDCTNWDDLVKKRATARDMGSEGIMLKRKASTYQVGRKVGDWWKWKTDPMVIDAVMVYAQKGHGRRSNLYTDYTFAVKDGDKLVTFTKAYSGLTDKEFAAVDAFVKANSIEKFGPVRTVKPALVFEIAFEGIAASNRHKSGVALRFPRINRWRIDKHVSEINTIEDLQKMLTQFGNNSTEY
ncbi:MAG: ATP-dependent DNA ligase [Chitinophagaceae bacterium]